MKQKNWLGYLLVFLGFAISFAVFYYLNKTGLERGFTITAGKVPSISYFGSGNVGKTSDFFKAWGIFIGPVLGLLAWLVSLALLGLLKVIRLAKFKLSNLVALFLVYGAYLSLAIELIYYENRFSALAIGIIYFVGYPLFYAAFSALGIAVILYVLVFVYGLLKKKPVSAKPETPANMPPAGTIAAILLLIALPIFLSGCNLIGWIEDDSCDLAPDPAHCYQDAAVSGGDADICAKVKQPAEFKEMGSNPPQDKCYMMVAQNTGDLEACQKIKGGLMSYSPSECILSVAVANENPAGCQLLTGADKENCVGQLGPKMTVEKALEIDNQIDLIKEELKKGSDPELEKQLKGLEQRRSDTLAIMTKDNKAEYDRETDPLNKQIIGDWAVGNLDSATKNKLIDMNERLKAAGSAMTPEQYVAVRDYYKFINDPANDIEKMDDAALAKDGLGDKFKNVVNKLKFWKTNDTADEKALDQQIRFYERMSERQAGIDKGLSEFETKVASVEDKIKEKATEVGADYVKDKVIEEIFGEVISKTAGITTKVVEVAIDEVKEEAKSAEFRGLVKAYDDGMAEELPKAGGDLEKAHAAVVKNLSADPYTYASGDSFAKYGNLVENKDCDGSNPHCIRRDVFWKAMKKSFNYQHPSAA